ncbi:hypothetical protein OROHE_009875 [Orobanche hederae]
MGSEGETSDLNSPIYVSVGRNVKEGKSLLTWAVENFAGRDIFLLHVHQPASLVSLLVVVVVVVQAQLQLLVSFRESCCLENATRIMNGAFLNGKLSASKLKNHAVNACQEFERLKVEKLMNQYLLFLSQIGKQADKVWIKMRNVEEGIIQLIIQHNIQQLIMGAGAETFKQKKSSKSKAKVICQLAPVSCHIWFISQGCVIYSRPVGAGSVFTTNATSSPLTSGGGTTLRDTKENMVVDVEYVQHPITLMGEVGSLMNPTVGHSGGDGSPSFMNVVCPEHLHSSSSNTSLADAAESRCIEEINRNRGIEEQLLRQSQEMETMKSQHNRILKELELIRNEKPSLESRLREAYCSEKELDDKIIQAVNLLITFKGTRDKLQIEYDSAIRKVNKHRALLTEDPSRTFDAHFFGISFRDLIEATQNFDPSQKIGNGRYGSVFKGMLWHVKVAIKMLPSSASQSDSEFKNETEILCRVRHPNLVTLIGACVDSRSLVYEYIENGSLEYYLSTLTKTSLSWQTRIRIAIETCSALIFLHANHIYNLHGNLKPSNILLDANFVPKISGFGISNLIILNENPFNSTNDPEKLAYMDPEYFENGELTTESDVYSFGVVLLRLLTGRPAINVVRDVQCALESGNLDALLDLSAGDWPVGEAKELASLGLRCCEKGRLDRPDLVSEVLGVLEPMIEFCNSSSCMVSSASHLKVPSYFLCPIFQEVMKDPHIAEDGFTYEADAIKGWFNSGHKTSPMTNLKLENCDLLPNYALYYAIQEWQQQNT